MERERGREVGRERGREGEREREREREGGRERARGACGCALLFIEENDNERDGSLYRPL